MNNTKAVNLYLKLFLIFISISFHGCEMGKKEIGFDELLAKISKTKNVSEKQELADSFIKELKEYPIFLNDTTYVLLYQGEQNSVGIIGDMTDWVDIEPMNKISGTNLFYLKSNAESDARLEYWLMFAKDGFPAIDPFNEYKALNGLGELSELTMPKYKRHPYFDNFIHGGKGDTSNLKEHVVNSKALKYEYKVYVYLPPDYNPENKYPTLYLQDGLDYIEFAQVPIVLDSLITQNKIKPIIAVFVTPPNRLKSEVPNRMTEYGLNDNYVNFFTKELVPFIDEKYNTSTNPKDRLVAGDSFGGLISAYIPFVEPDIFANGYSQSGYVSFQKDKLLDKYKKGKRKKIKLYVDSGIYERRVGANFLPADEYDFLMGNRRFKEVLEEKNYDFIYKEYPEGHTWGNWRRHLIDGLIYFFSK